MRQRIPALDSLRGIAVLAVVVFHGTGNCGIGWAGVDVFFVLSGFLITGILLDAKGAPDYYRHFYARRARRILPVYYGTLAILIFVLPHTGGVFPELTRTVVNDQLQYWTFLGNVRSWLDYSGPPTARHLWSLAIEEQFYLVWPLVVATVTSRRLAMICVALIAGALALRVALAPNDIVHFALFTRVDTLAAGAGVAVAVRQGRSITSAPLIVIGAAAMLMLIVLVSGTQATTTAMQTLGYSAFAIGSAAVIAIAATRPLPRFRPLERIGTYSYAAYVFHMPVLVFARLQWPNAGARVYLTFTLTITLILATLSWHVMESRILNWSPRSRSGTQWRRGHPASTRIDPS